MEIHKIKYVNFTGKWVEFWFHSATSESFDKCCKAYMFWSIVEKKGLENDINNNGIRGLYIVWDENNEPHDISRDSGYILDTYGTN
jgi:hypothetical protein